ncbi:DUF4169 family protein [Methylocystis bryophila]|uniref:DUF4169 domain-containing protein n=1 Tax=Methylocystis bryophila TaxID=655015 RepID=A0A1W6MZK4_9HYPH|nr:hypothetical protein B1812_19895 [Methylocystis bryophila]BDV39255.1 hypothetical protein DSM21852_25080 [Methylocystis bryophila]
MGEVVNLRGARKARERAEKAREAEANRVAFGRTKAERRLSDAQAFLERARLEGHRLDQAAFERDPVNADKVIDTKVLERDSREKPVSTFSHRAPAPSSEKPEGQPEPARDP